MRTETDYDAFADRWEPNARLALDTIDRRTTRGIPSWMLNIMQWSHLETLCGQPPGSYEQDPVQVYRDVQLAAGTCFVDQWIPRNPLTMKDRGYETEDRGATTGAEAVERDGIVIDSPEAVVEHMERFQFPAWEQWGRDLEANADAEVQRRIASELEVQQLFGMNMLKGPYGGFCNFPGFLYTRYGYANYFMAYALYPEVIERSFKL